MKTIWKYEVKLDPSDGITDVEIPRGAKILSVQSQFDIPHIWALVDTEQEKEVRQFRVVATGEDLKDLFSSEYIGSTQSLGGQNIWHIFEVIK